MWLDATCHQTEAYTRHQATERGKRGGTWGVDTVSAELCRQLVANLRHETNGPRLHRQLNNAGDDAA